MDLNMYSLYSRLSGGAMGAIDTKVLDGFFKYAATGRHYRRSETESYPSWTRFVRHFEKQLADGLFPQGLTEPKSLNPLRPAEETLTTMSWAITTLSKRYLSNPAERQNGHVVRLMIRDAITHFLFFSFDPDIRRRDGELDFFEFFNQALADQALVQMCRYRKKEAYDAFIADYTDLYCTYHRITGHKLTTFIVADHSQLKRALRKAGGIGGLVGIAPELITLAHRDPNGRVSVKEIEDILWEFKMV